MKLHLTLLTSLSLSLGPNLAADEVNPIGMMIFQDRFERDEPSSDVEAVGNGWVTNSITRGGGDKQADLVNGVLQVTQSEMADHSVLVERDLNIRNGVVRLRFRLPSDSVLVLNFADMGEESVHSGHLFEIKLSVNSVELIDLKTGRMNKEVRARVTSGEKTEQDVELLRACAKRFKLPPSPDSWHEVEARIAGDRLSVKIDRSEIGSLQSPGIAQPDKQKLRLLIVNQAEIDDVSIWDLAGVN